MMRKKTDEVKTVPQRDKLKKELSIGEFNWSEKQKQFIDIALDKNTKVIFVSGPAGSSKTLMSVFACLKLLSSKKISDILYVRSAVETGKKIGFLPGDVKDKLGPYNVPFYDKLSELLSKADINALINDNRVHCLAVNYARGLSLNVKGLIYDELQNSSLSEIFTILTRFGPYCKGFFLADPEQSDLPKNQQGDFEKVFKLFDNEESRQAGIHVFKFDETDIVRSDLVKFIITKKKELEK
jgi:phosphate starvation-inducible PhoH-like protein